MLLFWPVTVGSLLLVYHILMLWRWKVEDHRISGITVLPPPPKHCLTLYPPHPSSGCSRLSHTAPNIKWRWPPHPQHEQAMFISICAEQIPLSRSPLIIWRFCTKLMDFICRHHQPFSRYIRLNLREYLWENTLQLRSWGSDVEVSAAATLLQTTVVIYTTCTETIRRWLSYKLPFPVAGTN